MPEFPISSARILLVSQIQGGQLPSLPPVRYAYGNLFIRAGNRGRWPASVKLITLPYLT